MAWKSKFGLQKFNFTILVVFLFLCTNKFNHFAYCQETSQFEKARRQFNLQNYQEAKSLFEIIFSDTTQLKETRFQACIYLAWIADNQDQFSERDDFFRQAIEVSPTQMPDALYFRPSLIRRFQEVRDTYLTGLKIESEPADAIISLRREGKVVFQGVLTTNVFQDLLPGNYELAASKEGFYRETREIFLNEGEKRNVIHLTLQKKKKPLYAKWWIWALGGSAGAGAYIFLSKSATSPIKRFLPRPPKLPD